MKYGLSNEQLEIIRSFLSKEPAIEEAVLFGSRAIDTFKEASDIDLAIKGDSFDLFMANSLKNRLEDETNIPFIFDIIAYKSIKSEELKQHIRIKGVVIYRRMGEWKEYQLGDVAVFQRGHDLPKTEMSAGNVPVAGSNGIIGYHDESTTKGPGITIGRSGNIGTPKFYKNDFWAHNTVLYVKDFKGNDEKFIFYFLHTFDFAGFNAGSAVPTLNRNHIHEIPVTIPPLPEQKAIAAVLSSLDDKIDLLHRQNKTLEALAEAVWQKMFVEEAEEGWENGQLGDLLDTIESGSRPKGGIDANLTGGVPSIGAENINGLGYYDYSKTKFVREDFFDAMKRGLVRNYDVLIYKDGAYIGRKSMFGNGFPFAKCSINEHVFILRSNIRTNQFFLYFLLEQDEIEQLNANSAQPGINQESLKSLDVTIPNSEKMQQYGSIVKPWIDKVFENCLQIHTLEKLRDTLLPKLMSGEMRVKKEEMV
ncbi:MAG: restriction endonuclease subunit S [Patescibacteria group bacterium]